jgi:hypothetical protein
MMTDHELLVRISNEIAGLRSDVQGMSDRIDRGDRVSARLERIILGNGGDEPGLAARLRNNEAAVRSLASARRDEKKTAVGAITSIAAAVVSVLGGLLMQLLGDRK